MTTPPPEDVLPAETWAAVKSLFDDLAPLPTDERAAFLERATDDDAVRREVLALLAASDDAGDFLEVPAATGLAVGQKLGPYTVGEHLGSGGMGDVYRAHDSRLSRDVAVKVLRAPISDEASRARFEREAQAIAALSHPNILEIYDVGDNNGTPYLVTELLDGRTLRAELSRKRPSIEAALDWATQMARGLAAAHERGIIHRDLKPENLFLKADGRLKILDFGLARDGAGGISDLSVPGVVLGTVGYVSPEQARGREVTAAADLFALGAILFEVLTGERAFRGETPLDTLRQVIEHDVPKPSSLRQHVPPWLDRIVARLLAKETSARLESARDLAFALEARVFDLEAPTVKLNSASPPRWGGSRWVAAAAIVALAAIAAVGFWRVPVGAGPISIQVPFATPAPPPMRPITLTHSGRDASPTASPDGRFVAYASDRGAGERIWVHQLDTGREVSVTDGLDRAPRFSPDGSQLLFVRTEATGTSLFRTPLLGGLARKIADDAAAGDWAPNGSDVVFVRWAADGKGTRQILFIASVDGGEPRRVAELESRVQVEPRWSPDGRTLAVTNLAQQPGAAQTVALVDVATGAVRTIPASNRVGRLSTVAWLDSDTLVYSQALSVTGNSAGSPGQLVRQRISDGRVTTLLWTAESSLAVDRWADRGVVFDARSSRQNLRELSGSSHAARVLSRGGTARQPALSPDGKHIVFSRDLGSHPDLWILERATGEARRLTDHPSADWDPAFTADGLQVLWSSFRSKSFEVWISDIDGANQRQITDDGDAENPTATPDGSWIVYSSGTEGQKGVWRIRASGSEARLLVPNAILPEVSPDGRHVVFQRSRTPKLSVVGVAEIATGRELAYEVAVPVHRVTPATLGRARWTEDGASIAFTGQTPAGASAIFIAPFNAAAGQVEAKLLVGATEDVIAESFDIADELIVVAEWEQRSAIVLATWGD